MIYLSEQYSVEVYWRPMAAVCAVAQSTDSPAVSNQLVALLKVVWQNLQNEEALRHRYDTSLGQVSCIIWTFKNNFKLGEVWSFFSFLLQWILENWAHYMKLQTTGPLSHLEKMFSVTSAFLGLQTTPYIISVQIEL